MRRYDPHTMPSSFCGVAGWGWWLSIPLVILPPLGAHLRHHHHSLDTISATLLPLINKIDVWVD